LTDGVHRDGNDPDPGVEELVVSRCQADQLAGAVRSPVSTIEHDQHCRIPVLGQGPRVAGLIGKREVGESHRR
jgi:hypothetical protein